MADWWQGRRLKAARQRRGLTQATLGARVGVHQVTIARLETDVRRPSMPMLQRLARVLRVPYLDLLR